jgi:hypothetical protein
LFALPLRILFFFTFYTALSDCKSTKDIPES